MRVPRNIGEHPVFGFTPIGTQQQLPVLRVRYTYVGPVRPRHSRIDPPGPVGPRSPARTVPVGTQAAHLALVAHPQPTVRLEYNGNLVEWIVGGGVSEGLSYPRYLKARAAIGAGG